MSVSSGCLRDSLGRSGGGLGLNVNPIVKIDIGLEYQASSVA